MKKHLKHLKHLIHQGRHEMVDTPEENLAKEGSTPQELSPTNKLLKNKVLIVLVAVFLLTLVAIGIRTVSQLKLQQSKQQANVPQGKKVINQQVIVRRSKIPGVIYQATTAKTIDIKTGKVIQAARVFSLDDATVYLSLDLNKPNVGTRIDYIRYLNGRYIDHGSVKINKENTQNLAFEWTMNRLLGSRPEGKYKVATYTNGILEKRVAYDVVKNTVSYVYPEEDVSPSDQDYHLTTTLSLLSKR